MNPHQAAVVSPALLSTEKSPNEFLRHRGLDHAMPAWVPSRLVPPYARGAFWFILPPKKKPSELLGFSFGPIKRV